MEITEFEKKRAANLIWNSAHDYSIDPGFRVFDQDGKADLYWNSIVGAIHYHYDWKKLKLFYNTFHERINQGVYESLFWLALENAVYLREYEHRPVFPYLRQQYARRMLEQISPGLGENRADFITEGHFRHALGLDSGLPDKVDRDLLERIELGPDLDTDQIIAQLEDTLAYYFTYRPGEAQEDDKADRLVKHIKLFLSGRKKADIQDMGPVRRLSFGWGEHVDEYGSQVLDQSHLKVAFAAYTGQTDQGLKEYISSFFGESIYSKEETRKLELTYCQGNHQDVKLHFTRGEAGDISPKGYAAKMRQEALNQGQLNRRAYQDNIDKNRVALARLTEKIRNSILTHLEDQTVKSTVGSLDGAKVWRGLFLNDNHIFTRELKGDMGNITVDILLDASTSQTDMQKIVATQSYMIAESLTRCGIPVRVYSFCSINGYTIIKLYRDYNETDKNDNIFDYHTAGANRDGLAIRLATGMMKKNSTDNRILIVFSDCRPNDVIKVRNSAGVYRDYAAGLGIDDTAAEVNKARMEDISVLCVFTGDDESLAGAQRIYGRDFARIHKLEMFADAVGNMMQNHITSS